MIEKYDLKAKTLRYEAKRLVQICFWFLRIISSQSLDANKFLVLSVNLIRTVWNMILTSVNVHLSSCL